MEEYAVVPAWFKRRRLRPYARPPIVALTCWLADDARRATPEGRERLRRRMAPVDLVVLLSRNQTEILVDLGLREEQLLAVPFGIEEDFFTPPADGAVRDIDILAVGQDRGRDYATLFEALAGTDLEATVVCKPDNVRDLHPPPNVLVLPPVPQTEYRRLLRRARVVAVPSHELSYPTGQSVAMEAAATGACVVVTGTAPMREYFVDGETAFLPAAGSAESFRAALRAALGSESRRLEIARAGRELVLAEYTTTHMWERIFRHVEAVGLV
jgi:glycosyltransferase involved in cell wall biosynthesis